LNIGRILYGHPEDLEFATLYASTSWGCQM
jgi:hypothetical protein